MGGQLDKRMLHWQPATCCIFQLFIIICYLANKVLLFDSRLIVAKPMTERKFCRACVFYRAEARPIFRDFMSVSITMSRVQLYRPGGRFQPGGGLWISAVDTYC